jgi:hypothetical protein
MWPTARFSVGRNFEIVLIGTDGLLWNQVTNLLKSRNYKKNRYAYLKENIIDKSEEVDLIFLELSSLGFYSMEIGHFKNFVKDLKLNLEKCAETRIRGSYYI